MLAPAARPATGGCPPAAPEVMAFPSSSSLPWYLQREPRATGLALVAPSPQELGEDKQGGGKYWRVSAHSCPWFSAAGSATQSLRTSLLPWSSHSSTLAWWMVQCSPCPSKTPFHALTHSRWAVVPSPMSWGTRLSPASACRLRHQAQAASPKNPCGLGAAGGAAQSWEKQA